jgi:hypothetical protein
MRMSKSDRLELLETIDNLEPDEVFEYKNVRVQKRFGKWWTQEVIDGAGGYPQISKTPELTVRKIIWLLNRRVK